jgi:hypothetical protein
MKRKNNNTDVFIEITNQQIYEKLLTIEKQMGTMRITRWIATTALSLVMLCFGFLIQHLNK